jgi:hypothetical protein
MLRKVAILTVLCLAVSLWPARTTGVRLGDDQRRHVAGLGGHSAVLVTNARVRLVAPASHHSALRVATLTGAPLRVRPAVLFAVRPIHTIPSHLIATHLSL